MTEKENFIKNEDINRCSKCGLCQSVCPIYRATKNEVYLPRGRYITLKHLINREEKPTKQFIQNLDVCLQCGLCRRYCPSDINYKEILSNTKKQFKIFNFSKKYKTQLRIIRLFSIIYRFFPLKSIFLNSYIDNLFNVRIKRKKNKISNSKGNVVYFQGCFNKYVNPSDKNASLNLIERLGYKVIKVSNNCCGLPLLNDGKDIEFNKNAEKIVASIQKDVKYIVCSCKSCYETLCNINAIREKLITVENLLKINNIEIPTNEKFIDFTESYTLMNNFFMLKYPYITSKIRKREQLTEEKNNIVTPCLLSKWGLIKELNKNTIYSEAEKYAILSEREGFWER